MRASHFIRTMAMGVILCSVFAFSAETGTATKKSPWNFEAGISAGDPTPIMILAGVNYNDLFLRIQGLGTHAGANDFWCGLRGSMGWTFLGSLPFNFDMGIGGGYEYAEAPNKMHQALNKANKANFVLPYNMQETLDISAEIWVHMYGFFTQVAYPIYLIKDHDSPDIIWRIGYTAKIW